VRASERDPLLARFARRAGGVTLLVTGPFSEEDLGVACYHSKVGAVELLLNHMLDGPEEYVVVDMTAGADSFASGMFTRFDVTFLVVEPTRKAVSVWRQYCEYARDHGVVIKAVGNKVQGAEDIAFLREQLGEDLLVCFEHSGFVRALEQGRPLGLEALEAANRTALERLREAVDATPRDWERFYRQMVDVHTKNARAWANRLAGEDLTDQIDPEFDLTHYVIAKTYDMIRHA